MRQVPSQTTMSTTQKETQQHVEIQRCEDLWFEDGNLVIRAHETNAGVVTAIREFCVYRGGLKKCCDGILSSLDHINLSPDTYVEGHPVLPLYDDPVEDVTRFLKMLYTE